MAAATILNLNSEFLKNESLDLENIIKECEETEATWGLMQNDLMFAVAFWSMVECGFESIPKEDKPLDNQAALPKNWKHETKQMYEAKFVLPPHFDCPVKLVALPADDILCINVLASNVSPRNISLRSLAVHSSGYVPRPEEDTVRCKFSGLEDFHLLLKTAIIWPIRCAILTAKGIMNGSLVGLSDELKLKVVRHLRLKDVVMLGQTCHDLNRICNDQGLWKSLFHQNFKSSCKCSTESKECDEISDWKENFKKVYFTKKGCEGNTEDSPSASYHTVREGPYGSEIDFDID